MEFYKILKHIEDQLKGTNLELFVVKSVDTNTIYDDPKTYGFVECEIKVDLGDKSYITVDEKCDVNETNQEQELGYATISTLNANVAKTPLWVYELYYKFKDLIVLYSEPWKKEFYTKSFPILFSALNDVNWDKVRRDFMYYTLYSSLRYLRNEEHKDLFDLVLDATSYYALGLSNEIEETKFRAKNMLKEFNTIEDYSSFKCAVLSTVLSFTEDDICATVNNRANVETARRNDTLIYLYEKFLKIVEKNTY
jgi:hypothetical protein